MAAVIVRRAEAVVREIEQTGLTADEVRQLREILRDSQGTGDESLIPERLAAELPRAAGLSDWLKSPAGVAVAIWLTVIIAVLTLMTNAWAVEHSAPTVTQTQIEDVVQEFNIVIEQPPQAPSGPAQPDTPPTS